jgi:hypothetical protein
MKEMLDAYRLDREANPTTPFIIHFRISTSGQVDELNTHPHAISDTLAVAHNGHITGWGSTKKSDTLEFTRKVLRSLPDGWDSNEAVLELIEGYLGSDKMVLLNGDGGYAIINEWRGEQSGELWFSNTSYRKVKTWTSNRTGMHTKQYTEGKGAGSSQYPLATTTKPTAPATTVSKQTGIGGQPTGIDVSEVFDPFFEEPCHYCNIGLDIYDAEACTELGATDPVCFDCMIDRRTKTLDSGIVVPTGLYLVETKGVNDE